MTVDNKTQQTRRGTWPVTAAMSDLYKHQNYLGGYAVAQNKHDSPNLVTLPDTDLARELVAHPRWEWPEVTGGAFELTLELSGGRSPDGLRWRRDGNRFVPHLYDHANGGILLGMFGDGPVTVTRSRPRADVDPVWLVSYDGSTGFTGPTLSIAAARALLAWWGTLTTT